jgi:hypothetical protein
MKQAKSQEVNCKQSLLFGENLDRNDCKLFCQCKMPNGEGKNLEALVELYNKERLYGFLMCLKQKENLADCVTGCLNKGQLTSTHDAKFHSHVRRFPSHREAVLEVANKITEEEVLNGEIETFEQLIGRINTLYGYVDKDKNHVKFFGPLYIYDTAIRIGYHLREKKVMPNEYVYLQAGAWTGALNLLGKDNLEKLKLNKEKKEKVNVNLSELTIVNKVALFDKVYELERPDKKPAPKGAGKDSVLEKLANINEIDNLIKKLAKSNRPEDKTILSNLIKLKELIKEEGEPTKALIIEDFFCVFDDYLEGSPTKK